jgi:hypothetical protein
MLAELQGVRNAFVHSALSEPAFKEIRAAYRLGDDDG